MRVPNMQAILAMEREDMAVSEIWMFLSKFKTDDDPGLTSFTVPQRYVMAIEDLEAEVNNGGFDQYFVNSAGDHTADCLAGLQAIGRMDVHAMLTEAMNVFPDGNVPSDRDKRLELLEKIWEQEEETESSGSWNDLDNRYYDAGIELGPDVMKYVRAHLDEI